MENQDGQQVSQDLRNKLSKTLKKAQAPEQQIPQEESQEQSQMNPEQLQEFKETLHNEATFRVESLLQSEQIKQVLIGIGLELNRIANSIEKFAGIENATQ
jgi:Rps23 Pro-64 3,4-dihydroxylase Tpa1-like proline 4-hydroxylase